ncbi:hypothetical protein [Agromyces mangrovi Wang et al. 2018]|uniref:hypothetical protein n=1 Tax=Agromyces mangrovi TaxID=1858653 RepID=UPI00257235C0|nr:hypothetical protein [Agromyces mangrovi]BDZ64591.1 hypothetical protein GCM10025877_15290 [Agromyces mangrovi]
MRHTLSAGRAPAVGAAIALLVAVGAGGCTWAGSAGGPAAAIEDRECSESWMPPDFVLDGHLLESGHGWGCAWIAIGADTGRMADLIASEAWRLGVVIRTARDGGIDMGCADGYGPVRFEVKDAGDATLVLASKGTRGC